MVTAGSSLGLGGEEVRYGWGYGGQMVYVIPGLDMTVVLTSDSQPSGGASGHRDALHQLVGQIIDAVVKQRSPIRK
jgi:CubicO group peptidase (beta-lactamase class C family)